MDMMYMAPSLSALGFTFSITCMALPWSTTGDGKVKPGEEGEESLVDIVTDKFEKFGKDDGETEEEGEDAGETEEEGEDAATKSIGFLSTKIHLKIPKGFVIKATEVGDAKVPKEAGEVPPGAGENSNKAVVLSKDILFKLPDSFVIEDVTPLLKNITLNLPDNFVLPQSLPPGLGQAPDLKKPASLPTPPTTPVEAQTPPHTTVPTNPVDINNKDSKVPWAKIPRSLGGGGPIALHPGYFYMGVRTDAPCIAFGRHLYVFPAKKKGAVLHELDDDLVPDPSPWTRNLTSLDADALCAYASAVRSVSIPAGDPAEAEREALHGALLRATIVAARSRNARPPACAPSVGAALAKACASDPRLHRPRAERIRSLKTRLQLAKKRAYSPAN